MGRTQKSKDPVVEIVPIPKLVQEELLWLRQELSLSRTELEKIGIQYKSAIDLRNEAYRRLHYIQNEIESAKDTLQILLLRDIAWSSPEKNNATRLNLIKRIILQAMLNATPHVHRQMGRESHALH